jgi:hypothetical protein
MDPVAEANQAFGELRSLEDRLSTVHELGESLKTRDGRELTRTWVEAQANEAEEGYDISLFKPRNVVPEVHHVHDTDEVNGGES